MPFFCVGGINASEFLRTFNCGIGVILIVSASDAESVLQLITCETPYTIGTVETQSDGGEGNNSHLEHITQNPTI
jgi:phosphoribosylformylglycinamidine cyclo-ligase